MVNARSPIIFTSHPLSLLYPAISRMKSLTCSPATSAGEVSTSEWTYRMAAERGLVEAGGEEEGRVNEVEEKRLDEGDAGVVAECDVM